MIFINRLTWLQWLLIGFIVLTFTGTVGLAFGYISGSRDREDELTWAIANDIQTQYDLGLQDFEDGNYVLARERFDYVVQQDPNFPGAVDKLAETMILLSDPSIGVIEAPLLTPTPSPTPDAQLAD